jgi:hypothetical protein
MIDRELMVTLALVLLVPLTLTALVAALGDDDPRPTVTGEITETPPGSRAAEDDRASSGFYYSPTKGIRPGIEIVPGLNYDLWSGTMQPGFGF